MPSELLDTELFPFSRLLSFGIVLFVLPGLRRVVAADVGLIAFLAFAEMPICHRSALVKFGQRFFLVTTVTTFHSNQNGQSSSVGV